MKDINLQGKRVAVIGSRTFSDKQRLAEILGKNRDRIKMIVSGGARGADTLAVEWAQENGFPYLVFPARWKDPVTGQHDRGAGFRRNHNIIKVSDVVIAFWDGVSNGTKHSIELAKQLGKPVKVYSFETPQEQPETPQEQPEVPVEPEPPVETL